jgi:hypothetical protein
VNAGIHKIERAGKFFSLSPELSNFPQTTAKQKKNPQIIILNGRTNYRVIKKNDVKVSMTFRSALWDYRENAQNIKH